jgi:hypothetical protein
LSCDTVVVVTLLSQMSDMYLEQRNVDHSNNLQQAIKCPSLLVLKSRIVGAAL